MLDFLPAPCVATISSRQASKESLQIREPVDVEHYDLDFRSVSASTTHQARVRDFEAIDLREVSFMASIPQSRRSVSYIKLDAVDRRYRTIRIGIGSEELQQLAQSNVTELLRTATSLAEIDSNNARLARKALRYRKIMAPEVAGTSVLC